MIPTLATALRSLETQVLALASKTRTGSFCGPVVALGTPNASEAPSTLQEIRSSLLANGGRSLAVWSGASDRTIWSSPAVNLAFRVWHDVEHVRHSAEVDIPGEYALAKLAVAQIAGERERALLWGEVWGQVEHFSRFGTFPTDQRNFVLACADNGVERTIETAWS